MRWGKPSRAAKLFVMVAAVHEAVGKQSNQVYVMFVCKTGIVATTFTKETEGWEQCKGETPRYGFTPIEFNKCIDDETMYTRYNTHGEEDVIERRFYQGSKGADCDRWSYDDITKDRYVVGKCETWVRGEAMVMFEEITYAEYYVASDDTCEVDQVYHKSGACVVNTKITCSEDLQYADYGLWVKKDDKCSGEPDFLKSTGLEANFCHYVNKLAMFEQNGAASSHLPAFAPLALFALAVLLGTLGVLS